MRLFRVNAKAMNRLVACATMVSASLLGGGSLLVFGAFLIAGSFTLIRLNVSEAQGLLLDVLLSLLFFVQHSAMVRQSFRSWLSRTIPRHYYPAAYAIASGAVLSAVMLFWQTSPTVLVEIQGPFQWLLRAFSLLAIAGSIWGIMALKAFDALGQRAIRSQLRGKSPHPSRFDVRGPYSWVRHPLYFFTLVLIWSTPRVTLDRLLFNVLWTSWIVLGAYLEEKDLVAEFGERYRRYQKTVPMLIPWRGAAGRNL
jgi:methanethiol S-methyltransferase